MQSTDFIISKGILFKQKYHMSRKDASKRSLCGCITRETKVPLHAWEFYQEEGTEKWCEKCRKIFDEIVK